ncbi:hypothetical protein JTB14_026174 [Gonioctena quinquepunctata]|nr:hypothetical protein JTB14_026174 [Gonioctena quinquepunctata]
MASKHLGFEDLSSDLEYTVVVNSENDFNVNSKEERIKDEPVENEPSSEFVCDYIYLERVQDEKWCTPEFVKLEELQTEDVDDNLNWKTENAELIDSKSETGKETPNEDKFEEEGTGVKTASEKECEISVDSDDNKDEFYTKLIEELRSEGIHKEETIEKLNKKYELFYEDAITMENDLSDERDNTVMPNDTNFLDDGHNDKMETKTDKQKKRGKPVKRTTNRKKRIQRRNEDDFKEQYKRKKEARNDKAGNR